MLTWFFNFVSIDRKSFLSGVGEDAGKKEPSYTVGGNGN
jgi:hypothetical protein